MHEILFTIGQTENPAAGFSLAGLLVTLLTTLLAALGGGGIAAGWFTYKGKKHENEEVTKRALLEQEHTNRKGEIDRIWAWCQKQDQELGELRGKLGVLESSFAHSQSENLELKGQLEIALEAVERYYKYAIAWKQKHDTIAAAKGLPVEPAEEIPKPTVRARPRRKLAATPVGPPPLPPGARKTK